MTDFEFIPTKEQAETSNIFQFMKKHGISSLGELHKKSIADTDWFWGAVDDDIGIVWDRKYSRVSDFAAGVAFPKWFVGGKTNVISSTVAKFAKKYPDKAAYYFVSENNVERKITYAQLESDVNRLANAMKALRVQKGDVVAIYMPMIYEAILAMLAITLFVLMRRYHD